MPIHELSRDIGKSQVYLCLVTNGKARRGESILIHSGAGGIGLAAINMSLKIGLDIFVTVGTDEKRQFLRKNYPQIPESHIGNSRNTSFLEMVMRETNSRGVDLVLNSLADEKMDASIRCLARGGRFLEIGKYDLLKNSKIDMSPFMKGSSFNAVMLDRAMEEKDNQPLQELVAGAMNECFTRGYVKPLPKTIFDMNEPEKAFRYMTTGKHIGKVIMKVADELEPNKVPKLFNAVPRFFCNTKGTYIIIGGLGGFGLELGNWLVSRGATSLVVTSRKGIQNGFQGRSVQIWRRSGVQVKVFTEDIATECGVTNLFNQANQMAPVVAIYNLAVVLRDSVFENQTEESFKISFNGKANATAILDRISRKMCPVLEEFVVFSSVSCGRGNAGQTNYGMSNSVMERICELRKLAGYPALAIQWGAIGEVGLVAEMAESNLELVIGGTLQQTIASCLQTLDIFLVQDAPIVASMVVAEKRSTRKAGDTIVDAVCFILGIKDMKTVSPSSSLSEMGMDSMTGVEIKQTLERDFEVFLTAQDLRSMTFAKLAALDTAAASNRGVESQEVNKEELGLRFLITSTPPEKEAVQPICSLGTSASVGQPIFLVPGMDGIVSSFEEIAKGLSCPALAVRYPHKQPNVTSIQHTASYMLSKLTNHIEKNDFKLVGYSAGGCVALEMAAILEKLGGKGHVILVDGAPVILATLIKLLGTSNEPALLDNTIIYALQENITSTTAPQDLEKYATFKTREEKLDYLQTVAGDDVGKNLSYTKDYLRSCAVDLMQRVHNIVNYRRSGAPLKSKVTLIKPATATCPDLEDFGLSQLSEDIDEIFTVNGNHISMLQAPELPDLINNIFKN